MAIIRLKDACCRWMLPQILLAILLLLSGCITITPANTPAQSAIHRFDLPARQGLRDFSADFAVGKGGADSGIAVVPGERVEIFAAGSASVRPGGSQSGPEGDPKCRKPTMPEPSLACYSVIYSIGMTGRAGEVGAHRDFTATTDGNIFLGVNSPNLAQNSGSFHITILTIPIGTIEGIWTAPESGFIVQGMSITLSMHAFSQHNSIVSVQFTAAMPGQAPVSICDRITVDGDTYSCLWNLTNLPGNGPITFGFTIIGSQGNRLVNPDGVRPGIARYVETRSSDIYAGYAAQDLNRSVGYAKVTAQWMVPQAHCSPGENSFSLIWVGMTGTSNSSKLAQLGTEGGCQSGVPQYYMWWEMFPAPLKRLIQPLHPGDIVTATVAFQKNGQFQFILDNHKGRTPFSIMQPDNASDTLIAECIAEAPTIKNPNTSQSFVAQLTDFGTVSIFCQVNNGPVGDGPQNILYQMLGTTGLKATTSDLDQAGYTFTVQWNHG